MRIYIPATLELLRCWRQAEEVPSTAERYAAEGESEGQEYAALISAAEDSAALLTGPGRRVVVVAEPDHPDAAVPVAEIAALHVDPSDRPANADPAADLAWFATQELDELLS